MTFRPCVSNFLSFALAIECCRRLDSTVNPVSEHKCRKVAVIYSEPRVKVTWKYVSELADLLKDEGNDFPSFLATVSIVTVLLRQDVATSSSHPRSCDPGNKVHT